MPQRFGMDRSNFVHNPIVPGVKLTKDESGVNVDKTYYKQIVGSPILLNSFKSVMSCRTFFGECTDWKIKWDRCFRKEGFFVLFQQKALKRKTNSDE
ncbi:hypothetical protein CR513_14856, partial [Mucuna pruriens]